MPPNRCTPQEGVTSLHGYVNGLSMRQLAQALDGVHARRDSTCRPGSGLPRRSLTTRVIAATHGRPGVRTPGVWWCGRALVRMSVALGRHRDVGHAVAEDTGGRQACWRRACSVLCDCRALATAGTRGGVCGWCGIGHHQNQRWRFHTHSVVDIFLAGISNICPTLTVLYAIAPRNPGHDIASPSDTHDCAVGTYDPMSGRRGLLSTCIQKPPLRYAGIPARC